MLFVCFGQGTLLVGRQVDTRGKKEQRKLPYHSDYHGVDMEGASYLGQLSDPGGRYLW